MLFCKDNSVVGENKEGVKGDTVPVTYHRSKTLVSLHISQREKFKESLTVRISTQATSVKKRRRL